MKKIIYLILSLMMCSCLYQESLTKPHQEDYEVAWCDEKYIYVITDTKNPDRFYKIRNTDKNIMFVGDYITLLGKFR